LASVAVPVPFLDILTYRVPDGVPLPARGARVVVPLGKRSVTGIVVDPAGSLDAGQTPPEKIKSILLNFESHFSSDAAQRSCFVYNHQPVGFHY
jgi:primosomal protein N'